jgi:hypothetical protein
MRRHVVAALLLFATLPVQAHGQKLRDHLVDLFTFASQSVPLRVSTWIDPNNPSAGVVADDGFGASVSTNAAILGFLVRWVGAEPGNIPVSASSGGVTFNFAGAVPVRDIVSPGPLIAEGAATLGKGRTVIGLTYDNLLYNTLRGVPLDDLRLQFTHANDATSCSGCAALGAPLDEADLLDVALTLDMRISVATLFATYGLFDNVDLGVVVPFVHSGLEASSVARIDPFGTLPSGLPRHILGGDASNPVLSSNQSISGSATGIGDIGARLKVRLGQTKRMAFALLGDLRLSTGDEADYLGSGFTALRGEGIVSMSLGGFSPHLNVGYLYRSGESINDALVGTAGFDQVLSPWATFAASLLSEIQVGTRVMKLPGPVTFTQPVERTVLPMDVPDGPDDPLSLSLGFKLTTLSNLTATASTLIPITRTGPRPDFGWGVGLHYDF